MIRRIATGLLPALLAAVSCGLPAGAGETGQPPPSAETTLSGKLSGAHRVSGRVRVADDVTVLPGATLEAIPGTEFLFEKSDSTKVDPEYFHGGAELVVRGELRAEGAVFRFPGRSGGVVVDGGHARFSGGEISGAESGLTILRGGTATAESGLAVRDCRIGIGLFPGGRLAADGSASIRAAGNGVGLVRFPGAHEAPAGIAFDRSEEADLVAWEGAAAEPGTGPAGTLEIPAPPAGASRISDTFIDGDRALEGDIVVDGIVRVAPGATLRLAPGTRMFFTFRDTDGDGIGENGLFLQGNLDARGTPEKRIGFYPASGDARGLWDSVNFMASDQGENVLEHVDLAGGYRGLHAHFSRFSASDVRIDRCFRGMQFQESEVALSRITVLDSISVLRGRDSTVRIDGLAVRDVVSGVNLFRSSVTLSGIEMDDAGWYGARLRDSRVTISNGRVRRAFVPLSVQEGSARVSGVSAVDPGLSAFSLLEGDVTMDRFRSTGSRVDGISAAQGRLTLEGGELSGYRRDAVHLSGSAEVVLKGTKLTLPPGAKNIPIHDGSVVAGLGIVRIE